METQANNGAVLNIPNIVSVRERMLDRVRVLLDFT